MRTNNDWIFRKMLMMIGVVIIVSMTSQGALAKDFAKVYYEGRQVVWDTYLPDGATGVIVRVLYTPNDLEKDSYLEEFLFEPGAIAYPFNGELEDGTYTWELRLLHKDASIVGFDPKNPQEGPIDENGRQIEIVGKPLPVPKGKIRISNSGRDSIQSGGFLVVDGAIPEPSPEEKK